MSAPDDDISTVVICGEKKKKRKNLHFQKKNFSYACRASEQIFADLYVPVSKIIQQSVSGSVAKWLIEFAEFLHVCCRVEQIS